MEKNNNITKEKSNSFQWQFTVALLLALGCIVATIWTLMNIFENIFINIGISLIVVITLFFLASISGRHLAGDKKGLFGLSIFISLAIIVVLNIFFISNGIPILNIIIESLLVIVMYFFNFIYSLNFNAVRNSYKDK